MCCTIQGGFLIWSEKLTVFGNSWLFAKFIQVNRLYYNSRFVKISRCKVLRGRALCVRGGTNRLTEDMKTSNT